MPPEQEELIKQAAEPVAVEGTTIVLEEPTPEPVVPATPEPTEEPVVDPNEAINTRMTALETQLAQEKEENEQLRYQQQLQATPKEVPTEPGVLTAPDPYSETYNQDLAVYVAAQSKIAVEESNKGIKEQLQRFELIQGDQVFKDSIRETKSQFSDFDFKKEQKELTPLMQNGLSMLQAKKVIDFDVIQEKLKQAEAGVIERQGLAPTATNVATNAIEQKAKTVSITLSPAQEARAAKIGKTPKQFAEMIHKSQERGEM